MRRLFFIAIMLAALAPGATSARASGRLLADIAPDRSVSYSYWAIEGATVRVRFVLPMSEARDLARPGAPPPSIAAVSTAVGSGLAVSAVGGDCEAIDQGEGVGTVYTLALTPGVERFELIFRCSSANEITLHDHLLFARAPGHVNYASIQRGGVSALRSFTADRQELSLPGALTDQGAGEFVWQALVGKLHGAESFCIVAGLLLLSRRWHDLGYIGAGLGVGYVACLMLALSGLVVARAPLTDIGVDGLLMILGGGALYLQSSRSAPNGRGRIVAAALFGVIGLAATLAAAWVFPKAGFTIGGLALFGAALLAGATVGASSSWLVVALAALFGLLDGGRLTSDLSPLHLPALRLAPMLTGDDLGAILAMMVIATAAMGVVWIAARRAAFARFVAEDLAGAGVLGFGVFWFVSHIYS